MDIFIVIIIYIIESFLNRIIIAFVGYGLVIIIYIPFFIGYINGSYIIIIVYSLFRLHHFGQCVPHLKFLGSLNFL